MVWIFEKSCWLSLLRSALVCWGIALFEYQSHEPTLEAGLSVRGTVRMDEVYFIFRT